MATKDKAQELRHAQTLRKLAAEEAAEAAKMKCGGKVKKMAVGGQTTPFHRPGALTPNAQGYLPRGEQQYLAHQQKEADRKNWRGGSGPSGVATRMARGGGVEAKGKTKGRFI